MINRLEESDLVVSAVVTSVEPPFQLGPMTGDWMFVITGTRFGLPKYGPQLVARVQRRQLLKGRVDETFAIRFTAVDPMSRPRFVDVPYDPPLIQEEHEYVFFCRTATGSIEMIDYIDTTDDPMLASDIQAYRERILAEASQPPCDNAFTSELNRRIASRQFNDMEIRYAWTNGYGHGDVHLTLRQDGLSMLELHPHDFPSASTAVRVPSDRFLRILELALDSDFACTTSVPREVCLTDVGKTSLVIRVGAEEREVWWDGRTAVEGGKELYRVRDAIFRLSDVFGVAFNWGPYGSLSFACN
jgi:hypothetical protein